MRYVIILLTIFISATAQDNPYAVFGHEDKTTPLLHNTSVVTLVNEDSTASVNRIQIDYSKGTVSVYNRKNHLSYEVRLKSEQALRWLSTDPKEQKYPSMSPYSSFGGNPILIIDPDGAELYVSGENPNASLQDLQSLMPEKYRSQLIITTDNQIQFQAFQNIPEDIRQYEGVTLLSNLINSQKRYQYNAGDAILVKDNETGETVRDVYDPTGLKARDPLRAIKNLSITPYSPYQTGNEPGDDFDGSVRIPQGEFTVESQINNSVMDIDRSVIVFHELKENYLRTETSLPQMAGFSYAPNGGMYYESDPTDHTGGAHEASGLQGKSFAKQLGYSTSGSTGTSQSFEFNPKK